MQFDFAHTFLVIAFLTLWAMIGQFTLIKGPPQTQEFAPKPKPANGAADTH